MEDGQERGSYVKLVEARLYGGRLLIGFATGRVQERQGSNDPVA